MRMRDLTCAGRPAFPPTWLESYTGAEPLRDDPLGGILIGVEWGRHNLSLELTNHWRGRRLTGRLVTDDVSLLSHVHALLSANTPMHLDEIIELEIPIPDNDAPSHGSARANNPSAGTAKPSVPGAVVQSLPLDLHPDVAALVLALVGKGLLTREDIEAARKEIEEATVIRTRISSPVSARIREAQETLSSPRSGRFSRK